MYPVVLSVLFGVGGLAQGWLFFRRANGGGGWRRETPLREVIVNEFVFAVLIAAGALFPVEVLDGAFDGEYRGYFVNAHVLFFLLVLALVLVLVSRETVLPRLDGPLLVAFTSLFWFMFLAYQWEGTPRQHALAALAAVPTVASLAAAFTRWRPPAAARAGLYAWFLVVSAYLLVAHFGFGNATFFFQEAGIEFAAIVDTPLVALLACYLVVWAWVAFVYFPLVPKLLPRDAHIGVRTKATAAGALALVVLFFLASQFLVTNALSVSRVASVKWALIAEALLGGVALTCLMTFAWALAGSVVPRFEGEVRVRWTAGLEELAARVPESPARPVASFVALALSAGALVANHHYAAVAPSIALDAAILVALLVPPARGRASAPAAPPAVAGAR